MALENDRAIPEAQPDELILLKKRARRRLIGASAVALFAAIVLPMVMDHQPAPPLKDIQVRIPSPDEVAERKAASAEKSAPLADARPIVPPEPMAEQKGDAAQPENAQPAAAPGTAGQARQVAKANAEGKTDAKPEAKGGGRAEARSAAQAPAAAAEAWEVQLGAYAEIGRVKNLLAKLKELGLPAYTENVQTPNGPRTRVRAGPFPSREAAEKARARIKTIGVDGPVAQKS
jgi:DedD protein